ncbi:hypothetical protein KAU39_00425 [bacterium]|nr:hypothetical protein [bacterium]
MSKGEIKGGRKMDKKKMFPMSEKGIALPLVILMALVLIPAGVALSSLAKRETKSTVKAKGSTQAIQLADAGIKRAMTEIVNNENYTGPGAVQSLSAGQYTVDVFIPGSVFEGNILPVNRYGIEGVGYVPSEAKSREARKIVALVKRLPFPLYDPFDNAVTAGDGGIDVRGAALVNGNMITSGTANVQGSVTTTGTITAGDPATANFPIPVVPVAAVDLGVIDLTGNTNFVINPGTYTCSSIDIAGTASITLNTVAGGPGVHLYCSGDIDAAGVGLVNAGADATTFFLYCTGESGTIDLHGTADIFAAIYAPSYDCFTRGTNIVTGAMNVYSYDNNGNPNMIYDPNLNGIGGPAGTDSVKMLSWREEKI